MPECGKVLRIAIVGAESTGKTTLAKQLALALQQRHGLRCTWVPEVLRGWCDAHGRTPQVQEQVAIAQAQQQAIEAAAHGHDVVVCDTTPLMTAVYSQYIFGDNTLLEPALQAHARCHITLLTALDVAWQPDDMRDGDHARGPVDALIRQALGAHGLQWHKVAGLGVQRLQSAVAAVEPALLNSPR